MKFVHTSDWHLGRMLHGFSLLEEQRTYLQWFKEQMRQEQPDALFICGDIYDRSVPSSEAIALFDDVLRELVCQQHIPVFAIAGNHDGSERFAFGSALFERNQFYLEAKPQTHIKTVTMQDSYGAVHISLLPFSDPLTIQTLFPDETIHTQQEALKCLLKNYTFSQEDRHILLWHGYAMNQGGEALQYSDSERQYDIGGSESVDMALFDGFDYVALGHLHRPQHVGRETIRYSGSPLKYSVSEAQQPKGYTVVDLCEKGNVVITRKESVLARDVVVLRGLLDELCDASSMKEKNKEHYYAVELLDDHMRLNALEKLRSVFPYLLTLSYVQLHLGQQILQADLHAMQKQEVSALFADFYHQQKGIALGEEQQAYIKALWKASLQEDSI